MSAGQPAKAETADLLEALWKRKQPLILERLALLDQAAEAASAAEGLPPALRREATAQAHNLAGSLGTFGFPAGTRIARQLEEGLEQDTLTPAQLRQLTRTLRQTLFPHP